MKQFYSEGGNNDPFFVYRFKIKHVTSEMFDWCLNYPDHGKPFTRFHVRWDHSGNTKHDVLQMELRDAYLAFQVAFAGEILEDLTWDIHK